MINTFSGNKIVRVDRKSGFVRDVTLVTVEVPNEIIDRMGITEAMDEMAQLTSSRMPVDNPVDNPQSFPR